MENAVMIFAEKEVIIDSIDDNNYRVKPNT